VGDKLQQSDGNTLTIDNINIVKHDEKVKVYNFTVADFHTYFVSELGIWVHNINCVDVNFNALLADKKVGQLREVLLAAAENPKLNSTINELWRPGAKIGNGGTADFVRKQIKYGLDKGETDHIPKAKERLKNLENIMKKEKLSQSDWNLAR
jgi:hypothetical protein